MALRLQANTSQVAVKPPGLHASERVRVHQQLFQIDVSGAGFVDRLQT